jgi:hypothetical protein
MSVVVSIVIFITVFIVGAIVWTKLQHDSVGRRQRQRRQATGLQGQVAEWLYWDAAVTKPDLKRFQKDAEEKAPTTPSDRALHAAVLRESLEANVSLAEAYERLKKRANKPLSRALLNGQLRRAIRIHWSSRYKGPESLFLPWYFLVASIRYGRRHMYLDTIAAALKELSKA